jgi:hypothetical protein
LRIKPYQPPVPLDELRGEAEWLCRKVAGRDLWGVPLYIRFQSELPTARGRHLHGCTGPNLDLLFRPHVGRRNWFGRGPAMLICDVAKADGLRKSAAPVYAAHPGDTDLTDRAVASLFRRAVLQTAVHELAHVANGTRPDPKRRAKPAEVEALAKWIDRVIRRPASGDVPDAPPFESHGGPWVRLALHFAHRARAAGVPLCPDRVAKCDQYGLSPTADYLAALGDEPDRLAGLGMNELAATRAPAAFSALWAGDWCRWHDRRNTKLAADAAGTSH